MDRNYYCITLKKMRKKQCPLDILAIFLEKPVVLQIIISPFVPLKLKRKLVMSVTVFEKPASNVLCRPPVYRSTSGNYDCYRRINISY